MTAATIAAVTATTSSGGLARGAVEARGMTTATTAYREPTIVDANGMKICYDAFGDPEATPVVLVMGLAAQMILWDDEFCRTIASQGFFVVRFDNRDIGRSSHLDGARVPKVPELMLAGANRMFQRPIYTLVDMAKDVLGLMDALGLPTAHVVGVSMGGAISQVLAIHFRSRLRSITSIMSSTGNAKLPRAKPEAVQVLFKPTPPDRDAYLARYVETWRVLGGTHFPFDRERTLAQGAASYARSINPPGPRRQLLAIIASGDRTKALQGVTTKTLVLHGTADPLVPIEGGRATAAAIPGARLIELEGMGHTMPRELWPQITAAIVAHARAAEATSSA